MPCVRMIANRKHEEYIRENRRDFNAFEGISDPLDVLKIVHTPRGHDPLINWIPYHTPTDQLYRQLSVREQDRLIDYVVDLIESGRKNEAEEIALCLAAFTEANLDVCLEAFIVRKTIWPSLIFRNAPPHIRDCLFAMLEKGDSNRKHILSALAWIGGDSVVSQFNKWKKNPPLWTKSLNVPPQNYARIAGWELAEDGSRRDLFFQQCTKLVKSDSVSSRFFTAISERPDICPWCESKLTNIFDFDPHFFGISEVDSDGRRIQIITCEVCTAFGTLLGVVDRAGHGQWSPKNSRPDYLPDDLENWGRLPYSSLSPAGFRPPLFAANQFLPTTFSQLGGHPTWIHDEEYPMCPECSKTMMFVGQIDRAEIEEDSEGTYYAFICSDCKTTATSYQQT